MSQPDPRNLKPGPACVFQSWAQPGPSLSPSKNSGTLQYCRIFEKRTGENFSYPNVAQMSPEIIVIHENADIKAKYMRRAEMKY